MSGHSGAVLYEMLAGRRAFRGEDVSDTLVSVLRDDPDWSRLSADVPASVRQAIQVCLQKESKQRVRDVAAVKLAMEGAFETTVTAPTEPTVAPQLPVWQRPVAIAAAVLASLAVGGVAVWSLTRPGPQGVTRFEVPLRAGGILHGHRAAHRRRVTGWSPHRLRHNGRLVAPVARSGGTGAGGGHGRECP